MNSHTAYSLWDSDENAADFWQILSNEQRAILDSAKEVLYLEKGEVVFRQGELPQQLFYVHAGTVKVSRLGGIRFSALFRGVMSLVMGLHCPMNLMWYRLRRLKIARFGPFLLVVCATRCCIRPMLSTTYCAV